jgi:hypothetical protein
MIFFKIERFLAEISEVFNIFSEDFFLLYIRAFGGGNKIKI